MRGRMPTVGVIASGEGPVERFKAGMSRHGFVEGRSIRFETHLARGDSGKLVGFAQQLVEGEVDLIAAVGAVAARAAQSATSLIPITYAVVVDPIGDGLAASSENPRTNMTGVTTFDAGQAQAHLGLLRSVKPDLATVAYLGDPAVSNCLAAANIRAAQEAGLRTAVLHIEGPTPDLDKVFRVLRQEGAQAIVALEHPAIGANAAQIAERALALNIPSIFARDQAGAGGLFAYGTSLGQAANVMTRQVSRVLRGEAPADISIETLRSPELVIDMRTAHHLGLELPRDVLRNAVRVN
jgi:putative tryptophan/tyrosine transport system substrate-binding protein